VNVYPFIEVERAEQRNVKRACALLEVSRAAFYDWVRHVPSARKRADDKLVTKIRSIHDTSKGTYGSPRVHAKLRTAGEVCGKNRIARLMQANGIVGRARRRFKRTTIADPSATAAAVDLVKRTFGPTTIEIDTLWCGDISFVRTWEGWLYLATVIDVASRRVVGLAMADHMRTELVSDALQMALDHRRPSPGLIFHSDRHPIHIDRVHRPGRSQQDPPVPVPARPVLGQRRRGKLLLHAQMRARSPSRVADAHARASRHL
jgi:hypothetical protein